MEVNKETVIKALEIIRDAVAERPREKYYDDNWNLIRMTDGEDTAREINYFIESVKMSLEEKR